MASNPEFPTSGAGALTRLNERSREIFKNIVESYLAHGEPVGSRQLSRILPMSLSAASVRNVMQDLEELGLVFSPHTSAGRLPTELGLRFFVDSLLQMGDLTDQERSRIETQIRRRHAIGRWTRPLPRPVYCFRAFPAAPASF